MKVIKIVIIRVNQMSHQLMKIVDINNGMDKVAHLIKVKLLFRKIHKMKEMKKIESGILSYIFLLYFMIRIIF